MRFVNKSDMFLWNLPEVPIIKPIKLKEYNTKQSKCRMVGNLPTRALLCGQSGSGKGILLSNMISDIYRDCLSRVLIFSPSIHVEHTWEPVQNIQTKEIST